MIDNSILYLIQNFMEVFFLLFEGWNIERVCLIQKYKLKKCFSNFNVPEYHQRSLLKLQILGTQQVEITVNYSGRQGWWDQVSELQILKQVVKKSALRQRLIKSYPARLITACYRKDSWPDCAENCLRFGYPPSGIRGLF